MRVGFEMGERGRGGVGDTLHRDCPGRRVLDHVTSRWALPVLTTLRGGPHRFSRLRDALPGVSEKMLSQTLRPLVADGLVARTVEPSSPPKVTYALTPLGEGVTGPLQDLTDWIRSNARALPGARDGAPPHDADA